MASEPDRSRVLVLFVIATAASAALWWFGSGLNPHWLATWLAPLPVLLLAPRVRKRWAALAPLIAYGIGDLSQWTYFHDLIGLPLPITLLVTIEPGVFLACCVLLFRRLALRDRVLSAAFAAPALWVAIEYLGSLTSPHGTFGSIAYTQMDALPVIQIAAVTGIWGIGFLLMLVPAAIAALASTHASARSRFCVAAIAVLLPSIAVAYGYSRLQEAPLSTLRVGLVSLEKPIRPALHDPAGQALEARYVAAIGRLAEQGARAVVIPETSFATTDATIPVLDGLAQQNKITLDAGIDFKGDLRAERNMAMVFQPGAAMPATYNKRHLLPPFEDRYMPGNAFTMLLGTPRIGLAICKDMDFHDIGQGYAEQNAQLLLVPAWDFGADGWLHSRMAIMRGVESGFAIARAARTGRLTLSDDRGRVLAEASSEDHDAEVVGDLPLRTTHTIYARFGDWLAWLALALSVLCILIAWFGARRSDQ